MSLPTAATTEAYHHCLDCNKKWAQEVATADPEFFPTCSKGQAPPILWIGCADSRVPETTILNCKPGQVFTHRNIANIINSTDISLLSIVQFAVFHLKVKHIVVAGHTSCGGVAASLANVKLDILDVWLQPLRFLREEFAEELEEMGDERERGTFLAKKNVLAGVQNLKRIPAVIDAVRERALGIHGVMYDIEKGLLEEVEEEVLEDEKCCARRVRVFERR
ncbi:Carbonic anhydrase [Cercospora zeina]